MEPKEIIENAKKWFEIRIARVNASYVNMEIDTSSKAHIDSDNIVGNYEIQTIADNLNDTYVIGLTTTSAAQDTEFNISEIVSITPPLRTYTNKQ